MSVCPSCSSSFLEATSPPQELNILGTEYSITSSIPYSFGVHYLVQVFPDLVCSDDEEDPEPHTAVEDIVADCQVGTILHYCLTSLPPRRHL